MLLSLFGLLGGGASAYFNSTFFMQYSNQYDYSTEDEGALIGFGINAIASMAIGVAHLALIAVTSAEVSRSQAPRTQAARSRPNQTVLQMNFPPNPMFITQNGQTFLVQAVVQQPMVLPAYSAVVSA
eukprot:TRINITY_DN2336_c0_g1_i4.p1 TRINITY_DN2336_c0_g1~~TRINITY_DN2336_c0_g1_i4.p1  ORF type:complete len:127 (-),score=2.41 TRINITY_DN2336_c0_g1_i4:16-396(-)